MSRKEAIAQYSTALGEGKNYYKLAVSRGEYPYPPALDYIVHPGDVLDQVDIGLVNIPSELIAGTKTEGRISALAGNFMPLLGVETEFAVKWIDLCEAHLSDEGIRDPIQCYEYLGRFYVQEGNKRTSVLLSYGAPTIPGYVTRLLPAYSDDEVVQRYYEFVDFYALSGIYGLVFRFPGEYKRLQAELGLESDHVWTEDEKKRFLSAFSFFKSSYARVWKNREKEEATPAEALLVWLSVFTLTDIRSMSTAKLDESLTALLPDIRDYVRRGGLEVVTEETKQKSIVSKLLAPIRDKHVSAAFIYGDEGTWTRSHEHGRQYVQEKLGNIIETRVYRAVGKDPFTCMEEAVSDGAKVIFATAPTMIDASRKIAAMYSGVTVLNCAMSLPYTGVRTYSGRLYECKFITGAIAGAMTEDDRIGYIANFPIYGTIAEINAFALGARMTNPRARVILEWSCLPGNPARKLEASGIRVISNRDASNLQNSHWDLEWGTYKLNEDGSMLPLAVPCWNFGRFYESVLKSVSEGTWIHTPSEKAVSYWWGIKSGVIDIQFSDSIPAGVRFLAERLREGVIDGNTEPFRTEIIDQSGNKRNPAQRSMDPEEIMFMDWLCENVDGRIPGFDELREADKNVVRILGVYRYQIPPLKEGETL
ncbi:MAG: BMP family ABC transporter substrate-binding protein [Oscillospiraceae bacterium]|nr:BMP family ABC transporter substrate-binding protein [Oscillospiraceae bacterium]